MSNKARTLALLQQGGWVTTADLMNAGCGERFGARICELRSEGYVIESELVRPGSWRYRLGSEVDGGGIGSSPPVAAPAVDLSAEPMALVGDFTPDGYDPSCPFRRIPVSELTRAA